MKQIRVFLFFLILAFFFNQNIFCQVKNDVKSILTNIIDLSKAKKYDEAVKYVAFCVDEKKKEYKTPVLTNKDQINYIKRIVKRIGALTEVSASYNIGTTTVEKAGSVEYQRVPVEFLSGSQKINSIFKFVTLNGIILLAEIE